MDDTMELIKVEKLGSKMNVENQHNKQNRAVEQTELCGKNIFKVFQNRLWDTDVMSEMPARVGTKSEAVYLLFRLRHVNIILGNIINHCAE